MGAISALSTSFGALRRNPILFAAAFVTALLGSLSYAGQGLGPLASAGIGLLAFLFTIVLTPFITAGIIGMAEESVAGRTRLDTFLREGKENYVSMLGAYLLFVGMMIVLVVGYVIISAILVIGGGFALSSSGMGGAASGVAGLGFGLGFLALLFVFLLAVFLLAYFFLFYDTAVVVSDESATGSLRRSASFVRHNLLSTLGFVAVYVLVTLVSSIPIVWMNFTTTSFTAASMQSGAMAGPSLAETIPYILAFVVLSTITSAFLYAYKTAFYVEQTAPAAAN